MAPLNLCFDTESQCFKVAVAHELQRIREILGQRNSSRFPRTVVRQRESLPWNRHYWPGQSHLLKSGASYRHQQRPASEGPFAGRGMEVSSGGNFRNAMIGLSA
jgi:hypothetical protein